MFAFAKASAAIVALASLAQATITISTPNIKGNSTNTISWTSTDPDTDAEVFTIELINQVFNSQFALANNVQTSQGSITFELPVVPPGSGYTLEFVQTGNINNIFATSAPFSVQENDVSSTSSGVTESSGAATGTGSHTSVVGGVPPTTTQTNTAIGTLTQTGPKTSATTPSTAASVSGSNTVSGTGSGTNTATNTVTSAPAATTSKSSATGLVPAGSVAAFIAGALALLF